MDLNKVSIIVSVYNGRLYIRNCLESLIRQTYKNTEIIIVNDGSTDGTLDVCKEYAKENENIKIVNKENEGVSIARLSGVKIASGSYISFVDADDWIEDEYIETMMETLGDGDIILAGISRILSEEDNRVLEEKNNILPGSYYKKSELKHLFSKMLCFETPFKHGILPYACNKIYKKDKLLPLMERVDKEIYDGEDVAVIFPYIINSKKVVTSDYCGYRYLIHKGSVCNQKRDDAYGNASRLYIWLYKCFSNSEYFDLMLPQLRDYFLRMIWKRDPSIYVNTNEFVFPYSRIKQGAKIIIYGAGDVGRTYYIQAMQTKFCEVIAWADKKVEYSELSVQRLIKPEEISGLTFDFIIVAIRSEYVCKQVFDFLVSEGIEEDKIILCEVGVLRNE